MAEQSLIDLGSALIGYVGSTAIGGIIESVSGETVLGNYSKLQENLKKYKPDGNHEIQTAILQSYLQATLQVCVVYGETVGVPVNSCVIRELLPRFLAQAEVATRKIANLKKSLDNFDESLSRQSWRSLPSEIKSKAQRTSDALYEKLFGAAPQTLGLTNSTSKDDMTDARWLRGVLDEYTELLIQLSQRTLKFPETADNPELNELLGEKSLLMQARSAKDREAIIREKILLRVESELKKDFGELPAGFRSFLLENWFNYFCGCFHYHLSRNPELARKFQSKLLADIEADQHQLSKSFEKYSNLIDARLTIIESNLARLAEQQGQEFAELKQIFFSMLPVFTTVSDEKILLEIVLSIQPEFQRVIDEIAGVIKAASDQIQATTITGVELVTEHIDKKIAELLAADQELSPTAREAKDKKIIADYLAQQTKDYPPAEIVGDIYERDKFFVDREEEQKNIPDWLTGEEKIVVIKGVSGDGKTALMTEILRKIGTDSKIKHEKIKGILTFYFRDFSGKALEIGLLEICKKADARLAHDGIQASFAAQYEEFRKSNPQALPEQLIANLCRALNDLGDVWLVFDNFESALSEARIKDKEIELFMRQALLTQSHLRFLLTSQVLPLIEGINQIRLCNIADLPPDYARQFLKSKGEALLRNGIDCGLAEATPEQLDALFAKLLPSPIALVSFVAYLETLSETEGRVFNDVLADETLFVGYQEFDADDKNEGARIFIRRQFALLTEVEQYILKALSIFPQAIEFPVLQSILPISLAKETILTILKSNSLVRKSGRHKYELSHVPKEVIGKLLANDPDNAQQLLHLKAVAFYRSVHKPVADCYTLEDFDTYFKEIEHCFQAGLYEQIVQIINEIKPQTTLMGLMKETLERSRRIENLLAPESESKANNHVNIGLALKNQGKLEAAIGEYDKAIKRYEELMQAGSTELAHELASAYMNKGVALINQEKLEAAIGEYDKAIKCYEELMQAGSAELADALAMAYMNKGVAFMQNTQTTKAIPIYQAAIHLWVLLIETGNIQYVPNLVKALNTDVDALHQINNWEAIAEDAIQALILAATFLQDENYSDHFKQQIGNDFGSLLFSIKNLAPEHQEQVFTHANEIGQKLDGTKFGDILRGYIAQMN